MGFTDSFTGGAHLELMNDHQTFGLGGSQLLSTFGVFNLAGAGSYHLNKPGHLLQRGSNAKSIMALVSEQIFSGLQINLFNWEHDHTTLFVINLLHLLVFHFIMGLP